MPLNFAIAPQGGVKSFMQYVGYKINFNLNNENIKRGIGQL